jgi:hypothetical protein
MTWAAIVLAAASAAGAQVPAPAAPAAATHVLAGELARVSLASGSVVVKLPAPWREIDVRVGEDTVISAKGRPLGLADLRPGERITIACSDDASGAHRARRIRIGGRPPSPSP